MRTPSEEHRGLRRSPNHLGETRAIPKELVSGSQLCRCSSDTDNLYCPRIFASIPCCTAQQGSFGVPKPPASLGRDKSSQGHQKGFQWPHLLGFIVLLAPHVGQHPLLRVFIPLHTLITILFAFRIRTVRPIPRFTCFDISQIGFDLHLTSNFSGWPTHSAPKFLLVRRFGGRGGVFSPNGGN